MLITTLLIKLTSKGPILFMQKRVGYNGKRFTFLKFRTMYEGINRTIHKDFTKQWIEGTVEQNDSEQKTVYKIKADPRRTPIGKWLRKFSIDELPQFFNVLKGDMSLVGPRPSLAYEVEQYKEWHKRRLETKPGITGLWQVSGRNLLSFEEMVKLDIYYI
jgi:lipopolysaccharide/colanic/teichoic acid biosynthesis glycosyltransferase